jgi:hypothetical protein
VQCWLGDAADVVLGVAAPMTSNITGGALAHWRWPLSWELPPIGGATATYAFPNHSIEPIETGQLIRFSPDLYPGEVIEVGDFRDRVLAPYPYMHVGFHIHGAASGGPVISNGAVVGINCRYMKPDGPGVVAQIRCLQNSFLDNITLAGESLGRRVTFGEFVAAGVVDARGYVPNAVPLQTGRVVRLDARPVAARGPAVEVAVWS